MNLRNLLIIISFFLSASIYSQVAVIGYSTEKSTPENETFTKALIKGFDGAKRIVLHDAASSKAPTHTLKTDLSASEYAKVNDPIFVDSTKTIKVVRVYGANIFAYISLNNLETSEIEVVKWLNGSVSYQDEKVFKYADFKYKKGALKAMKPNAKNTFFKKIKDKATTDAKNKVVKKIDPAIVELTSSALIVIRSTFPYQLKVTPDESSKGKTVLVNGGENYDFIKYSKMVFYSKNKIESKGRTFYRLIPICHGFIKKVAGDKSIARLNFGKKRMKKAIGKGLEIYANEGKYPLQLDEEKESTNGLVNIAVSEIILPKAAQDLMDDYIKKLEYVIGFRNDFTLLSRKSIGDITNARAAQKSENMMEKETIDQYKMLGADMVLTVEVSDLVISDYTALKGYYILNLSDVTSGSIIATKKYNITKTVNSGLTDEQSKKKVYKILQLDVKNFLDEFFPPLIQIIDIDKEKKGKAKTVVISGDIPEAAYGKYIVYSEKTYEVDGETKARLIELGEIILRQNEGGTIFLGKVKSGGREIFENMAKNEKLVCRRETKSFVNSNRLSAKLIKKLGLIDED